MKNVIRILALLVLLTFLASCAHSPRSFKDSVAMQQIRMDYITDHPGSEFNDHILKGEVVRGMNFMGVLASWGLPNLREIPAESAYEYWIYHTEDKDAGLRTIYELIFRDQILVGWNVDKNIASNGGYKSVAKKLPVAIGSGESLGMTADPLKKKH